MHGIGSSGEYCGNSDAHLDGTNVFYHESLGGKNDAEKLVNHTRGQKNGQRQLQKRLALTFLTPPL